MSKSFHNSDNEEENIKDSDLQELSFSNTFPQISYTFSLSSHPSFINTNTNIKYEENGTINLIKLEDFLKNTIYNDKCLFNSLFEIYCNSNLFSLNNLFDNNDINNIFPIFPIKNFSSSRKTILINQNIFQGLNHEDLEIILNKSQIEDLPIEKWTFFLKITLMRIFIESRCISKLLKFIKKSDFVIFNKQIENSINKISDIIENLKINENLKKILSPDEIYYSELKNLNINIKEICEKLNFCEILKNKLEKINFKNKKDKFEKNDKKRFLLNYKNYEKECISELILMNKSSIIKQIKKNWIFFKENEYKLYDLFLDWKENLIMKLKNKKKQEEFSKKITVFNDISLLLSKLNIFQNEKIVNFDKDFETIELNIWNDTNLFYNSEIHNNKLKTISLSLKEIYKKISYLQREKLIICDYTIIIFNLFEKIKSKYQILLFKINKLQSKLRIISKIQIKFSDFEKLSLQHELMNIKEDDLTSNNWLKRAILLNNLYIESNILIEQLNKFPENIETKSLLIEKSNNYMKEIMKINKDKFIDIKILDNVNQDINLAKEKFTEIMKIKNNEKELDEDLYINLTEKLELLLSNFQNYINEFPNNSTFNENINIYILEIKKGLNFILNIYIDKLEKIILSKENIIFYLEMLDINTFFDEIPSELKKFKNYLTFIIKNLEENFLHSTSRNSLQKKTIFIDKIFNEFILNFEFLQQRLNEENFDYGQFFNIFINNFSLKFKLDETKPNFQYEFLYREDLVEILENYVQKNRIFYENKNQINEFIKEKSNFQTMEIEFADLVKLLLDNKHQLELISEKYELCAIYIEKCKQFRKFFCNVINKSKDYQNIIKEIERISITIENWQRILYVGLSILKGINNLKNNNFEFELHYDCLKKIKQIAHELFLLIPKTNKKIYNEDVDLIRQQFAEIFKKIVDYFNLIFFNLGKFLEFDCFFKENNYNFILENEDFYLHLDKFIKYRFELNEFWKKLKEIRENNLINLRSIELKFFKNEKNYKELIENYFNCYDMNILQKMEGKLFKTSENHMQFINKKINLLNDYLLENTNSIKSNEILKNLLKDSHEINILLSENIYIFDTLIDYNKSLKDKKFKFFQEIINFLEFIQNFEKFNILNWSLIFNKTKAKLEYYLLNKKRINLDEKKLVIEEFKNIKEIKTSHFQQNFLNLIITLLKIDISSDK